MIAVARMVRKALPRLPTTVPIPTTIPTYTSVTNAASAPYTTVLLMTTSMSYKRYFKMAIPDATGMDRSARPSSGSSTDGSATGMNCTPMATIVRDPAKTTHFSCWRSSPWDLRKRIARDVTEAMAAARTTSAPIAAIAVAHTGKSTGLSDRRVRGGTVDAPAPAPTTTKAMPAPAAHPAHRQRGEGRRPSGKSKRRNVVSRARLGIHDVDANTAEARANGSDPGEVNSV